MKENNTNTVSVENTVNNVKALFALRAKAADLAGTIANDIESLATMVRNVTIKEAKFEAYIDNTPVVIFVDCANVVRVIDKTFRETLAIHQIRLPNSDSDSSWRKVEIDKTRKGNSKYAPTTREEIDEESAECTETCVSVNGKPASEIDKNDPTTREDINVHDNVKIPIDMPIRFRDIRVNFRDINIHIHTK